MIKCITDCKNNVQLERNENNNFNKESFLSGQCPQNCSLFLVQFYMMGE